MTQKSSEDKKQDTEYVRDMSVRSKTFLIMEREIVASRYITRSESLIDGLNQALCPSPRPS